MTANTGKLAEDDLRQTHARGISDQVRVAVACSGLGHIQRGVEAWAQDLGRALKDAGANITIYGNGNDENVIPIPCLRRTSTGAIWLARALRSFGGWHYGLGSAYEVEQATFALALWPQMCRSIDIVHVQDPVLAAYFEWAHRRGLCRAKVIYANGTNEGAKTMREFAYLQCLTAASFEAWKLQKPPKQKIFMIPNFIDTAVFSPGDRRQAREALGLPLDRHILLCCAAIRRHHKRIDYLISEFAAALAEAHCDAMLVIAGARESDTDELIEYGKALLGDKIHFLQNVPRDQMPYLYRAADIFTLASLHEMFGIVLLEAMATGLPIICNDSQEFHAIVGPAGYYCDLSSKGSLAKAVIHLLEDGTRALLEGEARRHVEAYFSVKAVLPQILQMYLSVLSE